MDKNSVTEALLALATGDKSRSETARLRDVFPEIERALEAGVTRTTILEELHRQGFTMTLKSFESALYRIRTKRRAQGGHAPAPTTRTPHSGGEKAAPGPASSPAGVPAPPADPSPEGDAQSHEVLRQDASMDPRQRRDAIAKQFIPDDSATRRRRHLKSDKE